MTPLDFVFGVLGNATWSAITATGRLVGRVVPNCRRHHRPTPGRETDRGTLDDIMRIMGGGRTIEFLRDAHFGDWSFDFHEVEGLDLMARKAKGAEHEFIGRDLERRRRRLVTRCRDFQSQLMRQTTRTKHNPRYRSVNLDWQYSDPKRYAATCDALRSGADKVCAAYDDLIRLSMARLAT